MFEKLKGRLTPEVPSPELKPRKAGHFIILALLGAALIVFPYVSNTYILTIGINILRTAFFAQCWNLMSGYAGLFSFGHAAYFGLGAYMSTWLFVNFDVTPWFGMFAGAAIAGLLGIFLGYLTYRYGLKENYFALTTLAFAEILRVIFNNSRAFNASIGYNIPYQNDWKVFQFRDKEVYYFIALIMLIGICVLVSRIRKTKMGLYFVALRENEDAANALGVHVVKYKLTAIAISAMLTALAGTFYAQYYLFIDPVTCFSTNVSISAITPCVLGGVGTVLGPVVGALIITPISEFTNANFGSFGGLNMVIYGCITVAVVMFLPKGVVGIVLSKLQRRRANAAQKEGGR